MPPSFGYCLTNQLSYLKKYIVIFVSLFCPSSKDYYLAVFALVSFISFCQVIVVCTALPFFSLKTNIRTFTFSVYEMVLSLGLMSLPFIPISAQVMLSFSLVIFAQIPFRLPTSFINFVLRKLVVPTQSTRISRPDRLILFTSLLSYYKGELQEIGQSASHAELAPLLITLVGIMSNHCLPSCQVAFGY